ncbi:MAG: hypothetical protein K940chlam3_00156 [Chlamydiae bacterium]|nr:hypothetical protein [Chlamydiota bacterium]
MLTRFLIFISFVFTFSSIIAEDWTIDPERRSWVLSANHPSTDFPIQNLPYGVFKRKNSQETPRIGVAIGNQILDVKRCVQEGLLKNLPKETQLALMEPTLNAFMNLDKRQWKATRHSISGLLDESNPTIQDHQRLKRALLVDMRKADMLMPAEIGDYTDFYSSINHAQHIGKMFRPNNPLMPNYRHLPVGYHGRASSIVISGSDIRRPKGQVLAAGASAPQFQTSDKLDFELEVGVFIGKGTPLGEPIPIAEAKEHLFGIVLVNDWSARDIQKWEYQPLGPFNGKNFATSISPWVITFEALKPYKIPGPPRSHDDPEILAYLQPKDDAAYNIFLEVAISSEKMREQNEKSVVITRTNFSDMYWTFAQMLTHHTCGGCNFKAGDLIASGTVSGEKIDCLGCLVERGAFTKEPLRLPDGSRRKFLEDGDEITLRAFCKKPGYPRIGFGECCGVIKR